MHLAACEESAVDPPDAPRRSALKVQPSDSQRSPDSLPSPLSPGVPFPGASRPALFQGAAS